MKKIIKNITNGIIKRKRFFTTDKDNVTDVIFTIDKICSKNNWIKSPRIKVASCEWDNGLETLDEWFIEFYATNTELEHIQSQLFLDGFEYPINTFAKSHTIQRRQWYDYDYDLHESEEDLINEGGYTEIK